MQRSPDAGTHPPSRTGPTPAQTGAGTHPHPLSSRLRGTIPSSAPRSDAPSGRPPPPAVLAAAGTHPPSRTGPTPAQTEAGTHPDPLSSRMRGPIPSSAPRSDAPSGRPIPHPLSSRLRGPIPSEEPVPDAPSVLPSAAHPPHVILNGAERSEESILAVAPPPSSTAIPPLP